MVELKDHLHVTFREALVAPAHIVVPRPHAVYVTVEEVIQTPGAVRQLAKALCKSCRGMAKENDDRKHEHFKFYSLRNAEKITALTGGKQHDNYD